MNQTTTELKNELAKARELLQTLRDEVRLEIHLAGMEAKDQWSKLEPYLAQREHAAQEITEASRAALHEAVARLRQFRDSLRQRAS